MTAALLVIYVITQLVRQLLQPKTGRGQHGTEPAGDAAAAKSEFDVELTDAGQEKVKVIKEIRDITGKGLLDAKKLVDGAPVIVKEGASEDDANKIKEQLEGVGATVTLK